MDNISKRMQEVLSRVGSEIIMQLLQRVNYFDLYVKFLVLVLNDVSFRNIFFQLNLGKVRYFFMEFWNWYGFLEMFLVGVRGF